MTGVLFCSVRCASAFVTFHRSLCYANVLHYPPLSRECANNGYRKLEITVFKVLNMDIILTQTHHFTSEGLYLPPEQCGALFMMEGCTLLDFKISTPTGILKLGRAQDIFLYNSDCIRLKEESWGNFHF